MGLLETILNANNGGAVRTAAKQTGLSDKQAFEGLINLIPALADGVKKNTGDRKGLESLFNTINNGKHEAYLDNSDTIDPDLFIKDGNGILGHILGSKETSRQVAAQASETTGISSAILKKLLPIAASIFMGSLAKNARSGSGGLGDLFGQKVNSNNSGMLSNALNSFLDKDKDGSIADDLLGMAAKMFF